MPKNILLVIALFLIFSVKAIDTLTVRQVYTFNVGDTMDFLVWNYNTLTSDYQDSIYQRRIVTSKTLSITGDSIFITFNLGSSFDLTITDLDSLAVFYGSPNIDTSTSFCTNQYQFDTTTYPGFVSNSIIMYCFESGGGYRFTNGLGRTYFFTGYGDPVDGYQEYSETLVYYSNGVTRVGTPLEDLNGSKTIHYIPVPEECASWTRQVYGPYEPPGPGIMDSLIFTEQIRTGTSNPSNGYNYVEMIYSALPAGGTFVPDTPIGYFYNDTVNRWLLYSTTIGGPGELLCDFTVLPGTNCYQTGIIDIDSVLIGNQYRTRWYCTDPPFGANDTVIAGIGHLYGLMKVLQYSTIDYFDNPPESAEIDGTISCFSVCGQTLYPNDAIADCAILSGVQQINVNNTVIKLYPSVNDGTFMLSWGGGHNNDVLKIFDLTGRFIQQYGITNTLTTCQLNELSKGMYLWQAVSNDIPKQQGKFIIE